MLFEFIEQKDNYLNNDNYFKKNLYDLDTGFEKGNMFEGLYDKYKNYEPKELNPKNEKEMLYLNILKLSFALNDLNLYLDVFPNDQEKYDTFRKYALLYQKCLEEYEKKYQVLDLCHDVYGKYTWKDAPWPWEDKYV